MIDLSNDAIVNQYFAYESIKRDLVHLVLERRIDEANSETVPKNSLFISSRKSDDAEVFRDFMVACDWNSTALIYSKQPELSAIADRFRSIKGSIEVLDEFQLAADSGKVSVEQLSQRLKPLAKYSKARIALVMLEQSAAV